MKRKGFAEEMGYSVSSLNAWPLFGSTFVRCSEPTWQEEIGIGFYAGLDISLDAVAVCIVCDTGEMLRQGKVLGDPDAVGAVLHRWRDDLVHVGLEAAGACADCPRGLVQGRFI